MSEEELESSTNGLKGQDSKHAHSIQEPALIGLVHWTTFVKVSQRRNVQETFFDSSRKILPIYRLYCTTKKTHLYYQPKEYESLHDTEVRKETFTGYQTYIAKFICLVLTVFSSFYNGTLYSITCMM